MIEVAVTGVIAMVTGIAVLTNRTYSRILDLDKRIDKVELNMAKEYVSKESFNIVLDRVEAHMLRIEDKLDKIIEGGIRR